MGIFICQREQCLAFGTAEAVTRMLSEKKHHKSENQAEADCKGEWYNGHKRKESPDTSEDSARIGVSSRPREH